MRKIFKLLVLLALGHVQQLSAQTSNPLKISFGASNGIPVENYYGYSLGGDIKLQKNISSSLALTFSAGFNHYFETGKQETVVLSPDTQYPDAAPFNSIPLKAGLKIFPGKQFYLSGEAGAGLFLEGGKPCFVWSPSAGLALSNGLDLSVKYESFDGYRALRQVALRIAYGGALSKIRFKPKSAGGGSLELNASVNPGITISRTRPVLGADLQLERYFSEYFALTLSSGFVHFFDRPYVYNISSTPESGTVKVSNDQNLIPFKLGLKVFPADRIYLAAAAGLGVDINGNSSFVVSATAGVKTGKRFDIGVKYENYTEFYKVSQLSLRLGYRIF